jgi:plasmid stabilization system protein ParE
MAAELIITPEAREDLDQIYTWYEARRLGKGEDFLLSVEASLSTICRTPEIHAKAFGTCRSTLIRKFPYVMIYEFEVRTVTVYGVFHTSRDQNLWRERLP